MDKPGDLKNEDCAFLGWRKRYEGEGLYLPRTLVTMGYGNIHFIAAWEGALPFRYCENPPGEIVITAYTEEEYISRLIIPDTLEGKRVTRIGDSAFENRYLSELILPQHLTHIGNNAFSSVGSLSSLTIPGKVREIGMNAFQNCAISSLTLRADLETIGAYAFSSNSLEILMLPQGLRTIALGAFNGNSIIIIEIGPEADIQSDSSLGIHGASFRDYYAAQGRAAGFYRYIRGAWKGPARD
jgi:hypothetical protein